MNSILECSSRTTTKIIHRMNLGCFQCGWNECRCDLHHRIPKSKGGTDSHENLTYLCPNCHRKAHRSLLAPHELKSFAEVVGDRWKEFYNAVPNGKRQKEFTGKVSTVNLQSLANGREIKAKKRQAKADAAIKLLYTCDIDKTKYGWIELAAKVLDVAPQSVVRYLKKYAPSYLEGAKTRRKANVLLIDNAPVGELVDPAE